MVSVTERDGRLRGLLTLRNVWHEARCEDVLPRATAQVVLREPAQRRGWQYMAPLEVFCLHPLGAFVTWAWLRLEARVLVYPRPVGEQPLPWVSMAGEGKVVGAAAGDDELSGLRPYVLGDALSRVAWKRFGRGELLLKQFAGEGAPRLLLDFAAAKGGTEQRLSQLAKWVMDADRQGLLYALRLPPDVFFDFGHGREHREACLRALALFGGGA